MTDPKLPTSSAERWFFAYIKISCDDMEPCYLEEGLMGVVGRH